MITDNYLDYEEQQNKRNPSLKLLATPLTRFGLIDKLVRPLFL